MRNRGECRYFNAPGGCFAGDRCKFMHVPKGADPAAVKISPYDANKVCRYFQQGYCRRGAQCWFKHEPPPAAAPATPDDDNDDDDDLMCAICLEKPTEYGLLENCNHVYCRGCIRGWREPQGKSVDVLISQMNKTCPSCRTRSRFIIPSSAFPRTPELKKTMLDNYKASMARVACRYFAASPRERPFCPYGRDCFYRHALPDGTPFVFREGVDALMERWKRKLQNQQFVPRADADGDGDPTDAFLDAIRSIADTLLEPGFFGVAGFSVGGGEFRTVRLGEGLGPGGISDAHVRALLNATVGGARRPAPERAPTGASSTGATTNSTTAAATNNGDADDDDDERMPPLEAVSDSSSNEDEDERMPPLAALSDPGDDEDYSEMPPLERVLDPSDVEHDWATTDDSEEDESEDEDADPVLLAAIDESIRVFQRAAGRPPRPPSPDPNRQLDVFELD
ncbi:hypothetical protein AURDEDRAFT_113090 [Auricularia subglabra TFB-10046 SS5]|nr:hypothetical protein AURDEDRAFT_113090 [Auricularia subglabra TFB-10046 SS5]